MQILSKNYELPQGVKSLNKNIRPSNFYQTPSFKSTKTKIAENLGKEIFNNIKLDSNVIKELLSDPKKRTLFFEMLGATIVSTVANLVNLASDEKTNENTNDKIYSQAEQTDTGNSTDLDQVLTKQEIKFDTVKGVAPQIEKDYIKFVNENFESNPVISDRLKLLFNKFAAHNRKGSHVLDENIVANRDILSNILVNLTEANSEEEKVNEIINKYQGILSVDSQVASAEKPKNVEIEISKEIKDILNRYNSIKKKYFELLASSATKKEAKEKLKSIDNLLLTITDKSFPEKYKKSINNINTYYTDNLEDIASLIGNANDCEKYDLYNIILNRELSAVAIDGWKEDAKNLECPFSLYNEFVRNNLDQTSIKALAELYYNRDYTDIKIDSKKSEIKLSVPNTKSINWTFSSIKQIFELVTGNVVDLKAADNAYTDEASFIQELKNDFKTNGKTTYPNIIKYVYGQKHVIYNERSFDNNQIEFRLNLLLDVLNNEYIFNPNFFSPHCKFRILERFVLNHNFGKKSLKGETKEITQMLISSIKESLSNGVNIEKYQSKGGFVGVQMIIPNDTLGDIKITLDDQSKIHTIF